MDALKSIGDKLNEKYENHKLRRQSSELKMAFYDSAHFIPTNIWDKVVPDANIYLSVDYLKAIEDCMTNISFRYVIFYDKKIPVAVASFQIVNVDDKAVGVDDTDLPKEVKKIEGKILEKLQLRCMINGSLFASGETGFYYCDSISHEVAYQALAVAMYRIRRAEKLDGQIAAILIKDYFPDSVVHSDFLKKFDYREFCLEPNMVLKINDSWTVMDDYLSALVSRYRSRAKDVYKASSKLIEKDLNAGDMEACIDDIAKLFHAVHEKASFKLGYFNVHGFIDLKKKLGDKFILKLYSVDNKNVGFVSMFITNNKLDANYVGVDYNFNKEHSIYLRMLYDAVKVAIENNVEALYFGRTASEIKSALGAIPVDMKCYMRHRNTLSNKIIKPLFGLIEPTEYIERYPFKKENIKNKHHKKP